MSSAVTGKEVPVKVPNRSVRLSVLRLVRMAVAFVVVAGSLGLATATATAQSENGNGGTMCPSAGAENYSDVVAGSTHADDIACLRELGISEDGDTYRPGADITRSEMAAFMANAYEQLTGSAAEVVDHPFTDVADDPNGPHIARIYGLGITTGTTDTTYSPDATVIRAHMALFLTRLYEAVAGVDAPAGGDTGFTDISDRSAEQQAAIAQIKTMGVTTGTSPTTYSPANNVTRAQMGSFVARIYRVLHALVPGAPTGVTVAISGDAGTALTVSWGAPSGDVSGYVVQWKSGDEEYSADDRQQSTDSNTHTFTGLTKGTAYTFRVAARNGDMMGAWSGDVSLAPGTKPGQVRDFNVGAGSISGTLVMTWAPPADDGGTPITGYVVIWAETGRNPDQTAEINDATARSHTITGLKTGVDYRVHIEAVNAAGRSERSNAPGTADTSGQGTGNVRTRTPSTSVGSGSVRVNLPGPNDAGFSTGGGFHSVTWLRPTLARGQHLVTPGSYDIQRKCGTEKWPATHTGDRAVSQAEADPPTAVVGLTTANVALSGGDLSAGVGSLTNGVECSFRVRANTYVDKAGGEAGTQDSNEATLVGAWETGSATPLGVPGIPVASVEVANGALNVTWTPPMTTDTPPKVADGGTAITGYKIVWLSGAPLGDRTVSASTRSHTITGLTNEVAYGVMVLAVNARGESAPQSPAIGGTPDAVPGAPTNVRVTQPPAPTGNADDLRGTRLVITWNKPADNGTNPITGYVLQRRTSATTDPVVAAGTWEDVSPVHEGTGTTYNAAIAADERGTSYDYQVRARNGATADAGLGPWSTFASGTAASLPAAVNADSVEVIGGHNSLTLTWTAPASNGSDITHYLLRYARNQTGNELWSSAARVPASLLPTYTITGLANGVPYTVELTAVNAVGRSETATTVPTGTNRPTAALPKPTTVTAKPASTGNTDGASATVTWSAVPNALGYIVEWLIVTGDPSVAWTNVPAPTGSGVTTPPTGATGAFDPAKPRTVTFSGLTAGSSYVVRVRAYTQDRDAAVTGGFTGPALLGVPGFSAPFKAAGAPGTAPSDLAVTQVENTKTLRVTWTPFTGAAAEGITGYQVTWTAPGAVLDPGSRGTMRVTGANAKTFDITTLANTPVGTTITVTVAAVNAIGVGTASGPETHDLTAPTS